MTSTLPVIKSNMIFSTIYQAATAVLALVLTVAQTSAAVLPPSEDPFYTAPPAFENAAPGDVLRVRIAPGNFAALVTNTSQAYHILFRTTDSQYQPSWAVTTLFVPNITSNVTGAALLSYQIPYNSPNIDESPSYTFSLGYNPWYANSFEDVAWALGRGWYVTAPDFEGPLAAFGAGPQAGHATLDSIRAVKALGLGLEPDARVALWGYSGGSFASEFATEMQVQYAPELHISGAAVGGLVDNFTAGVDAVNGQPFAGLISLGLLGLTAQYPEARTYVLDQLLDTGSYNESTFLAAFNLSTVEVLGLYANQSIWNFFRDGSDVLTSPQISSLLHRVGTLGLHGIPKVPLFIYKAVQDEVTAIEGTDELVERYCKVGANVWYQRNTVGDHIAEVANGKPRAFQFLQHVLERDYPHEGCTVEDVTIDLIGAAA